MNDQISAAAKMAGEWWAARLDQQYADKRQAFACSVAKHCEAEMRASYQSQCVLQVDYDPLRAMLLAVQETVYPDCCGSMMSATDILPMKHILVVFPYCMRPKEGYGSVWGNDITVPDVSPETFEDRYKHLLYEFSFVEKVVCDPELHPKQAVALARKVLEKYSGFEWESEPLPSEYVDATNVEHFIKVPGVSKVYNTVRHTFEYIPYLGDGVALDPGKSYDLWLFQPDALEIYKFSAHHEERKDAVDEVTRVKAHV